MAIPTEPEFLEIASDVTSRFKAHGAYGDKKRAIKALRRRAPGFTPEEYEAVFDFLCNVYDRAVAAIPNHPAERPEKTSEFAEFADIDYAACLNELNAIEPGLAIKEKHGILNWCIYWHYLR